ncbi:hypothetical protein BH10BAC1_BH10BAC1_12850 [soil metagenome]
MRIPAFCDNPNCNSIFSSGIEVANSRNVTLVGNKSGPCPNCGGMGHIPDGVFNFIENTIEILSAPGKTIEELKVFTSIIKEAYEKKLSHEAVADKIKKEAPSFSRIIDIFPKTKDEWYSFIGLALMVASLVYSQKTTEVNINNNITVNQVIEQVYLNPEKELRENDVKEKMSRKEKCHCGSGVKYKKCHGK